MDITPKNIKDFLLIYEVNDFPDNGGGIKYTSFDSVKEAEDWINERESENISIHALIEVGEAREIIPVTRVTKYEIRAI